MERKLNKKAYSISDIPWLAITVGIGIVVLSIGTQIVGDLQSTQAADTTEYNVSGQGAEAFTKIGDWLPTIGVVLGAVIVIAALSILFVFKRQ